IWANGIDFNFSPTKSVRLEEFAQAATLHCCMMKKQIYLKKNSKIRGCNKYNPDLFISRVYFAGS
ncbi:MAG TPA: hypothetical protein VHA52_13150, partial [Candidatus Babeliaceae bacterium]|nr:hypothetical protein [Candidatus Babeliaceae bacterium]